MVPQCNPGYTVLIGPPSHWSPDVTPAIHFSLVPHLIGPPMQPWLYMSHWPPISMVPQCNPGYTVLIGPPSHWSPNVILVIQFSLVPHLIGPPMQPWLYMSHWSPISMVPQCNPGYTVLIGPPSQWSHNVILVIQFSLVPHLIGPTMQPWLYMSHWSPISMVPQCNPGYTVLIGPPSHWSPSLTLSTMFYTVLIGPSSPYELYN